MDLGARIGLSLLVILHAKNQKRGKGKKEKVRLDAFSLSAEEDLDYSLWLNDREKELLMDIETSSVEDLSIEWEEDGELVVEELEKSILTKGAWATLMFKYRERARDGGWGEPKVRIQRYRKQRGRYTPQSKFNISSAKQARKIVDQLITWFPEEG